MLSRFDVDALNPSTGAAGLFQVDPLLWEAATIDMGLASPDPFDPARGAWCVLCGGFKTVRIRSGLVPVSFLERTTHHA